MQWQPFLLGRSLHRIMADNVSLKVDGKEISLTAYPEKVMVAVTAAIAGTLHGVEEGWKKIEIVIER
jgi:hypothetical protein